MDDLLITGNNDFDIEALKQSLKGEFEMTDLGKLSFFLGMEFVETKTGMVMHQKKYITEMLKRFQMGDCNTADPPVESNLKIDCCEKEARVDGTQFRQLINCLRFVCNSRPEIIYGVGLISQFMSDPRQSHMTAAKRVLRYLKRTLDFEVLFPIQVGRNDLQLVAYSDSNWCGDKVERKSTMGYIFLLSGAPISWCSKRKSVMALSTFEAEYIAVCHAHAACQALWISALLEEWKVLDKISIELLVDIGQQVSHRPC